MTPSTPAGGAVAYGLFLQNGNLAWFADHTVFPSEAYARLGQSGCTDPTEVRPLYTQPPATVSADAVLALVEADRALDAVLERDRLRREAGSMLRFTEEIEIARTVRNAALDELEALTRGERNG